MCICFLTDKSTVMSDCSDGSIRLSGGNNSQEGRLEVCINQAFGTVCDIGFSLDEAEVVCRSLGLFNGKFMQCMYVHIIIEWQSSSYIKSISNYFVY